MAPETPKSPSARCPVRTVLVVEDDFAIREAVRDVLEQEGYRVVPASNGSEALRSLDARKPCLMLLDLMMPVMNGWQLLDALRERAATDIPVVVVSASDALPTERVAGVIRKPFDLDSLIGTVERYCPNPSPSA